MSYDDVLFLDIETTGLDPKASIILEVGCYLPPNLKWTRTCGYSHSTLRAMMDDDVWQMHSSTGLINRCTSLGSTWTVPSVEHDLIALADEHFGNRKIMLAGFSIQFDRAFIVEHMPRFAARLSHRQIDVSTIRRFLEEHPAYAERALQWRETGMAEFAEDNDLERHRALDDCIMAHQTLVVYSAMITPKDPTPGEQRGVHIGSPRKLATPRPGE